MMMVRDPLAKGIGAHKHRDAAQRLGGRIERYRPREPLGAAKNRDGRETVRLIEPIAAPGDKAPEVSACWGGLLRGLAITRPNQVWAMDITYIAMARGFVYLAVALDWFSRRVLAWRLSITMEAAFCIETLEDALARYGKPEIFNTDQGSQFTGQTFTGALAGNGVAISMDGKGAWRDNVFVERLWRSVKYEEVYLRAYDSVSEARASIGRYFDFYNGRRPHASLDGNGRCAAPHRG
jgi:transposase InsO family protein